MMFGWYIENTKDLVFYIAYIIGYFISLMLYVKEYHAENNI
mgnify:CR=1 FL=1